MGVEKEGGALKKRVCAHRELSGEFRSQNDPLVTDGRTGTEPHEHGGTVSVEEKRFGEAATKINQ